MRPKLLCLVWLFGVFIAPQVASAAGSIPYGAALAEVIGTVQTGSTPERLRIADQAGDIVIVSVSRDSTFVTSRSLLAPGQFVRVDGHLAPGRAGDPSIDAEEISAGTMAQFETAKKQPPKGWALAARAAAGVLLGSGIYVLGRNLFRGNQTAGPGGAAAVPASGSVQFGNP